MSSRKMMKKKERKRIIKSIRTRMTLVFVVTTVLISITSVFILITSKDLIDKMDEMLSANVKMEEFTGQMELVDQNLTKYLVMDDSDSLLNYYKGKEVFAEKAQDMFEASQGIYSQDDLIYKDIVYMVDSYIKQADAAAVAKGLDDADEYIQRFAKASEIKDYIKTYADRLNLSKLEVNTAQYLLMSDDISRLQTTNIILIVSVICMNV
jgi:hypothetical protein